MKLERLVTHRFALSEAPEAFELNAGYRDGVIKAMVFPGSESSEPVE